MVRQQQLMRVKDCKAFAGEYVTTPQKPVVFEVRMTKYQGKEKEAGKRKDGKTTSESGPVSTSTAVREQPKTVRDGRRLSPMPAVVPLRP